jgi:hypothetical protein
MPQWGLIMKRNQSAIAMAINLATRTVSAVMPGRTPITVNLDTLSENNKLYAALYGISVRVNRAAAIERLDENGTMRSDAEMERLKYERMSAVAGHLNNPDNDSWEIRARGEGGNESLVVAALMRVKGVDETEAKAIIARFGVKHGIDAAAAAKRVGLIKEVGDMIATIRAERAGVSVSIDELV